MRRAPQYHFGASKDDRLFLHPLPIANGRSVAVLPDMILRQKLEPLVIASAVLISRFACRSHDLYDLDSVNFALAMERFDPRVHQPHPPGYFLYVCLGRLLNSLVHDANLALVLLSIAASC